MRERTYPLEPCPAQNGPAFSHALILVQGKRSNISQWHFGCFHSFVQTTTNLLYSLYSSLFDSIYLIPDTNSWSWKMQPLWDRERRRKNSRKICERGVPGNFYLAQPPYNSVAHCKQFSKPAGCFGRIFLNLQSPHHCIWGWSWCLKSAWCPTRPWCRT